MLQELRLENIDDEIIRRLKSRAANKGVDLNTFILSIFKQAIGMEAADTTENQGDVYHDLDYLAGTWTEEEAESFMKAAEDFNKIDSELWK
jgi:hypothetical protein